MANQTGVNVMWCKKTLSLEKYRQMKFEAITIDPYQITNGKFLSPIDAVKALKTKVNSMIPIAVISISSTTEEGFINQIRNLGKCWDLPEIKRVLRTVESVKDLDLTKMIIPNIAEQKVIRQLSSNNSRSIINDQLLKSAQKNQISSINNLVNELSLFEQKKNRVINEISNKSQSSVTGKVDINFFYGLPVDLHKSLPNQEHIFTFLLAFSDNDLTPILDLVHDRKYIKEY